MQKQTLDRKLILFAFAAFLLSVKADGRFPLPESLSETTFQLLLLPYSILFVITIALFFRDGSKLLSLNFVSSVQLTSILCLFFEFMILAILFWEERKYETFGYRLNRPITVAIGLLSVILLLRILWWGKNYRQLLITVSIIFVAHYSLSILSFPLHAARSDMLPLIREAAERFLAGANPHTVYNLPHSVPLTYLPGMWMAYVPAVLAGFDLRLIHLLAVLCSMLIAFVATTGEEKERVALFSCLFLMMPYLHYRHEIYLGVFWAVLSVVFFFHKKNKPFLACIFMGIGSAISQFAWLLIPFLILAIQKQYGWKKTALCLIFCIGAAAPIILPFVLPAPEAFYQGVFRHWEGSFNATTLNFSYFVSHLFSLNSLKYFQLFLLAVVCLVAIRNANLPRRAYEFMTYALMLFLLFNPLIWVYFYLTLFPLMIFHIGVVSREVNRLTT